MFDFIKSKAREQSENAGHPGRHDGNRELGDHDADRELSDNELDGVAGGAGRVRQATHSSTGVLQ